MNETSEMRATWKGDISGGATIEAPSVNRRRILRMWAGLILALTLINLTLAVWYAVASRDIAGFLSHQLLTPVATIIYTLLGVLVISRRPRNSIGWLFLATGTSYALSAMAAGLKVYGSALPATLSPALLDTALWLDNYIWLPAQILPTTFVFLLFPDGRLLSRRWRLVAWMNGLGLVLVMAGLALHPGPIADWGTLENPLGLAGTEAFFEGVLNLGSILLVVGGLASILSVILRFRRSRGIERQQMKWLAYWASVILIGALFNVPLWFTGGMSDPLALEISIALTTVGMLGIAVAAAVAIAGYGLYDIDILINRTLVYGVMTGVVLLIYGVVVGGAGLLFQTQGSPLLAILATALVAILFQPIYAQLQRGVNRLLYGRRDEPFEVLARLGQQLEQTITADSAFPTIVETVAEAMRLPYVAIQTRQNGGRQTVESYGVPRPEVDRVAYDLVFQGEVVGWLQVARRAPGEAFSRADDRLLRNIARQAGAAVYNARLTADLQRSRQQIITGREEERRRLRRDLHDGLGPALASLLLEARVLRRLVRDDPPAAEALADEMQGDIRATIDDIRRVVHELRPPALDDLGLVAALNVMAAKTGAAKTGAADTGRPDESATGDGRLRITIEAPDEMPPLPAAVEVAAYRIVQEALANVVHHARAGCATVRLRLDGDLVIEVIDDGVGFRRGREDGLGLRSMRERATELGGNFSIKRCSEGGTSVRATLPAGDL
jgi:two-component system, NarL family, sensor kinase